MPTKRKPRLLTGLEVDEVSGVDEPANDEARVVLMKAADAIPGMAAIRKSLGEHGDAAAEAFDDIVAASAEPVAAIIAKAAGEEADEDALAALSRMAHALGESVSTIFKGAEGQEREALLADTGDQFADAIASLADEMGVAKAKPPGMKGEGKGKGEGFKPCADCPDPAACTAAGRCAAEAGGKAAPVAKAAEDAAAEAAEMAAAMGAHAEAITKAAATFAELNANREERDKLNRMAWALQDSLSSILSDPEVKGKEKVKLIRQSVSEFDAAVDEMLGDVKKAATGGDAAGEAGDPMEGAMSERSPSNGGQREDVVKSLQAELAAMRARETKREAVQKAKTMLPAGGPVEALGELLASASEEQLGHIEKVVKGLTAQVEASRLYGSFGAAAAHGGDMAAESPVVKAAKASAEAVQKRRAAR